MSNTVDIRDFSFPDNYPEKYWKFIQEEALTKKRFLLDSSQNLYLSDGNGSAEKTSVEEILQIASTLDRYRFVTLWEVSPLTYHAVSRKRKTQLVLRNEILSYQFQPNIYELYPNILTLRRTFPELPLLLTPEFAIPVLYNENTLPTLIYDSSVKILYSPDGCRGVFGKIVEEVRNFLTTS